MDAYLTIAKSTESVLSNPDFLTFINEVGGTLCAFTASENDDDVMHTPI